MNSLPSVICPIKSESGQTCGMLVNHGGRHVYDALNPSVVEWPDVPNTHRNIKKERKT